MKNINKEKWEVRKLGELCKIQLGKTPYRRTAKFWDKDKTTDNIWLSIADLIHGDVISDSREYVSDLATESMTLIPEGTMLLSFKLTLGRVSFAGTDLYTNEAIASLLELSNDISKDFLFYYFTFYDWDKATEGDVKVKGRTLNKSKLQVLPILVPPMEVQQRIVSLLDEAFEALDEAQANAEKNLENAKELFESYLEDVFENKGEDWEEKTLKDISENLDRKRVPIAKRKRIKGDIPYYGASGIVDYVNDYLFDEDLLCISEDGANLLARTYPIAFSISGKTWVNNHAHVLKFKDYTTQRFVEYYINSIRIDDYVSGMAQPKLNQRMLNTIPIPVPSLNEQKSLVEKFDLLQDEVIELESHYQTKLDNIIDLRKSILEKAFSGELM